MKKVFSGRRVVYVSWGMIIIIIIGLAKLYPDMLTASRRLDPKGDIYRAIFSIAVFLIGVLVEHDRLELAFKNGFSVEWIGLSVSIVLMLVLMVPIWIVLSIISRGLVTTILQTGLFRSILGICSGILFARSVTVNK